MCILSSHIPMQSSEERWKSKVGVGGDGVEKQNTSAGFVYRGTQTYQSTHAHYTAHKNTGSIFI